MLLETIIGLALIILGFWGGPLGSPEVWSEPVGWWRYWATIIMIVGGVILLCITWFKYK